MQARTVGMSEQNDCDDLLEKHHMVGGCRWVGTLLWRKQTLFGQYFQEVHILPCKRFRDEITKTIPKGTQTRTLTLRAALARCVAIARAPRGWIPFIREIVYCTHENMATTL